LTPAGSGCSPAVRAGTTELAPQADHARPMRVPYY